MKITLLTYGSRGDVQPFLALAVGLKKAGHSVHLAAPSRFAAFVERHGIPCISLAGDPEEISKRFNDAGQNPYRTIRAISDYVFEIAPDVVRSTQNACEGADCIIHSFLFTSGAHAIAREMRIPDISVQTFPMFAPTSAFPNVATASLPAGWASYLSHRIFDGVFRYGSLRGYASIRKKDLTLHLPQSLSWPFDASSQRPRTPLLFAFSRRVIPVPIEWEKQDHLHVPGYFFLEETEHQSDARIQEFLANGPEPVCITFGSMVNRQISRIQEIVTSALHNTKQRGIILSGWGNWNLPENASNRLLIIESAPHEWIFPRCKLVIHHGGAGTTAAALRHGKPSMVLPMAGDQPFWARCVDRLGVGPHSIDLRKLSVGRLEDAILMVDHGKFSEQARIIGQALGEENGTLEAVRIIEKHTGRARGRTGKTEP